MRSHCTLVLLMCGMSSLSISAQSIDRSVIATAGSTSTVGEFSLDWTLGELAVSTVRTSDVMLTEGFQQSYLMVDEEETLADDGVDILVAPNPVRSELTVYFNSIMDEMVRLDLFDVNGRAVESLKVDPTIRQVNVDMYNYPAGMYILRIVSLEENGLIKSYKITKVN